MPASDALPFFRAWISNPLRVAAVAPSGNAVAALMSAGISRASGQILELGPGTGPFTKALLARGVPEQNITLVEYDATFAQLLAGRFPLARVLCMDAAELAGAGLYTGAPVGAVISGLGILTMPPDKACAILAGAFACLAPSGAFHQITYGPRCPVPPEILDCLGLEAVRTGWTLRNLPPASVYRITRRRSSSLSLR